MKKLKELGSDISNTRGSSLQYGDCAEDCITEYEHICFFFFFSEANFVLNCRICFAKLKHNVTSSRDKNQNGEPKVVFDLHSQCHPRPWLPGTDWTGRCRNPSTPPNHACCFSPQFFHRFSGKNFIEHFSSHQSKLPAHYSVQSDTWPCLGLAKVVINYTDIALAQSARGLLDSFKGSSKLTLWSLILALDFNIPLSGPRGALFCLRRLCCAGTRWALVGGRWGAGGWGLGGWRGAADVGQPLMAPRGQICANYTTNYTVGFCAPLS